MFVVETDGERADALAIRRAVFVDEQGVDESIEVDDHDDPAADATHFVAYDDGDVVGAARLRGVSDAALRAAPADDDPTAKVERVAVAADRRGEGWGRRIMTAVETRARERDFGRIVLHAQTSVRSFYVELGYHAHGEEFEEAGIPHVEMTKTLSRNCS
ncbi:MAG: GNAT family N-acetyltransferase [Haloquadratum sp.]